MLYVTTRDRVNVFTPRHALICEKGKCGGYFHPYRFPVFSLDRILALPEKTFAQRIADTMNLFFGTTLTGWDVEFTVGRNPVRMTAMNHKIAVLETWHNSDHTFDGFMLRLFNRMEGNGTPGTWFRIAARIAVLAAACGDFMKAGILASDVPMDIALQADTFEAVMAAWYARRMGLPIGTILFSCDEDSGLWDFFHQGVLSVKGESGRNLPACLEMLMAELFGFQETQRFLHAVSHNRRYFIREDQILRLRSEMCCNVIRRQRAETIVRNVYKTNSYLMVPAVAFAYGSLQDYRAAHGETGAAMILAEESPLADLQVMEKFLGIPSEDIKKIIEA